MPTRQPLAVVSSTSRCPILAGRGERAAQGQVERESGELCLLSRLDWNEPNRPVGARERYERVPFEDRSSTEFVAFEGASFADAPDGSNRSGEIQWSR
jgi:hypothetical protein